MEVWNAYIFLISVFLSLFLSLFHIPCSLLVFSVVYVHVLVVVGWCLDWFCLGRCCSLSPLWPPALILASVSSIWAKFSNGDCNRDRPGERRRWVPPFAAWAACFSKASQLHLPASCSTIASSFLMSDVSHCDCNRLTLLFHMSCVLLMDWACNVKRKGLVLC